MLARCTGLLAVVGMSLAPSPAHAQRSHAEELVRGSTYFLEMCLPPCACPYRGVEVAMHGTFSLRLVTIGDVFDFYAVENVQFIADTSPVETTITGSGTPPCASDVDDGTGTGTPDGGVTIDDLLYYLGIFADGSVRADIDDGTGTGNPDGGVTIDDLLYFLDRFASGC